MPIGGSFRIVRDELAKDGHPREERFLIAPFKVGVHRADGRWLVVEPQPTWRPSAWQQSTMLWFLISTLALAPIAYLFARRMARPIALFAQAAERLGRDPRSPPLEIKGPAEIAVAVRAFNDMQERLARYVDDRTAMIGAIAHDLRTPLTRLRFRLEAAPEEVRGKMAADIAEMEAMISGTLAFVRDATRPAARTRLELSSLLEALADEMSETGLDVAVEVRRQGGGRGRSDCAAPPVQQPSGKRRQVRLQSPGAGGPVGPASPLSRSTIFGKRPAGQPGRKRCSSPSIAMRARVRARPAATAWGLRSCAPWPAPTVGTHTTVQISAAGGLTKRGPLAAQTDNCNSRSRRCRLAINLRRQRSRLFRRVRTWPPAGISGVIGYEGYGAPRSASCRLT